MDFSRYRNFYLTIQNSRIENCYRGIQSPTSDASLPGIDHPTVISGSTLKNYINIIVWPAQETAKWLGGNVLEVRNVKFGMIPLLGTGPSSDPRPPANIYMLLTGDAKDLVNTSIVRVYDYNQVPGDDFQVYYHEQDASYILPQTNPVLLSTRENGDIGAPEAGLTNAEAWARYGIALAGAVAPAGATDSRPEINGLVGPIAPVSDEPPRVVLVTPWNLSLVTSSYVNLRYHVIGRLPAGATVYFQLDDAKPVTSIRDNSLYKVPVGLHTLRTYIGDSLGQKLAGTAVVSSTFVAYY